MASITQSMDVIGKDIRGIKSSLARGNRLKWSGIVSLILAVISGVAYVVRSSTKADSMEVSVQEIKEDVSGLKEFNIRMENSIVDFKKKERVKETALPQEVREAIREEFILLKPLKKKSKRGGGAGASR